MSVVARATLTQTQTLTLTTLRGLKIYLLFNRLVRRFVMSVNVSVSVLKKGAPFFNTLTLTLTLITNLLTNRLNNKYIFRPRSVVSVSVCVCVNVARATTLT